MVMTRGERLAKAMVKYTLVVLSVARYKANNFVVDPNRSYIRRHIRRKDGQDTHKLQGVSTRVAIFATYFQMVTRALYDK